MTVADISFVHRALRRAFRATRAPVIDLVAAQTHDPFHVLVGTGSADKVGREGAA